MKKKILSFIGLFIMMFVSIGFACEPGDTECIESANAFGDITIGGQWKHGTPEIGGFAQGAGKLCGNTTGEFKATYDSTLTGTNLGATDTSGTSWSKATLDFSAKAVFDKGSASITNSGSVDEGSISSATEGDYAYRTAVQTAGTVLINKTVSTTIGGEFTVVKTLSAEGSTGGSIDPTNFISSAFAKNNTDGSTAYANNQLEVGIRKEFIVGSSLAFGSSIGGGSAAINCPFGAISTDGVSTSGVTFTPSAGGLILKATSNTSEKLTKQ